MIAHLKLFFTDRERFNSRMRYLKLQRTMRRKLRKLANTFLPWSGYYMHEMVKTMIDFYLETYQAGDCCWRDEKYLKDIVDTLAQVKHYLDNLDKTDELEAAELITTAKTFPDFKTFCKEFAAEIGTPSSKLSEAMKGVAAYEFLEKKYTSMVYKLIGEHIWEWCD